jgi:hypothetical protein
MTEEKSHGTPEYKGWSPTTTKYYEECSLERSQKTKERGMRIKY